MKLKSITLYKVDIPMVEVFTTAFGNISRRSTVLVRVETDEGIVGWGESAALPPICLDKSILSAEDARKAIQIGACQIINIKPGRVAGLLETKKIHDICKKNKMDVWIGGLLELGIGRVFLTAAASLPDCRYPADLSPTSFYYTDDIIDDSLEVDKEGYIRVPDGPGLGVKIKKKKIKKYTIGKIKIS